MIEFKPSKTVHRPWRLRRLPVNEITIRLFERVRRSPDRMGERISCVVNPLFLAHSIPSLPPLQAADRWLQEFNVRPAITAIRDFPPLKSIPFFDIRTHKSSDNKDDLGFARKKLGSVRSFCPQLLPQAMTSPASVDFEEFSRFQELYIGPSSKNSYSAYLILPHFPVWPRIGAILLLFRILRFRTCLRQLLLSTPGIPSRLGLPPEGHPNK